MPRLSDGEYVLPTAVNPVVTNTPVTSNWANTTMSDIGATLTDCLDTEGRNSMNAPFKFANGTAAAPSITWGNDPSSGWYLAGVADMRVSLSGSDVFRIQGGQAQVWAAGQWNNLLYSAGGGALTPGTAPWQTLTWNNSTGAWVPTSDLQINDATGDVSTPGGMSATTFTEGGTTLSAKYLGISAKAQSAFTADSATTATTATNSTQLNGQTGAFYQNATNLNAGTVNAARLTGTYNISISQNAATATSATTATTATNCTRSITGGNGLTGGGALTANQTLNVGAGTGISVDVSAVSINRTVVDTWYLGATATAVNSDKVDGYNVVVAAGTTPPGSDPNTLYFLTG